MDNRINEIRRKMSVLRAEMVRVEETMHERIRHDLDSTEAALRPMAMRPEVATLVAEWKAAGGSEQLPTIE
jgi:low affinity Fe/Cu permease